MKTLSHSHPGVTGDKKRAEVSWELNTLNDERRPGYWTVWELTYK